MVHLKTALDVLAETGTKIEQVEDGIRIRRNGGNIEPVSVETQPFPGFPTDLQAQLMALASRARGTSVIRETIFENRFMHVQELARLGADIHLHGDTATIKGVKALKGAPVMATDLRASLWLVIAGLMAEGTTTINRVYTWIAVSSNWSRSSRGVAPWSSASRAVNQRPDRIGGCPSCAIDHFGTNSSGSSLPV